MTTTCRANEEETPPFSPFERQKEEDVTPEDAIDSFLRNGFLWIRCSNKQKQATHKEFRRTLQELYSSDAQSFERKWNVENSGNYEDSLLNAKEVLRKSSHSDEACLVGPFYVSAILHKDDESTTTTTLDSILTALPFVSGSPPTLDDYARYGGGCWLFLGSNCTNITDENTNVHDEATSTCKKRKFGDYAQHKSSSSLSGRSEHVDEVDHAGTWHYQISGSKTWYVRPNKKCEDWDSFSDAGPPDLQYVNGAKRSMKGCSRAYRLKIVVEEGDLFVLNTRAWYHRTELDLQKDGVWSISIARDFHLRLGDEGESELEAAAAAAAAAIETPVLLCKSNASEGDIVMEEDEIPDLLPQGDDPNCALAEIEMGDDEESNNGNDDEDNIKIVLIALRNIRKDEPLIVVYERNGDKNNDDDDDDDSDVCNADAGMDPRTIAARDFDQREIVLSDIDVPEDMPRSLDPNCEVVEEGDRCLIRSLCAIAIGEVLSIAPDDDGDYEEIEFDTATGEFSKMSK